MQIDKNGELAGSWTEGLDLLVRLATHSEIMPAVRGFLNTCGPCDEDMRQAREIAVLSMVMTGYALGYEKAVADRLEKLKRGQDGRI